MKLELSVRDFHIKSDTARVAVSDIHGREQFFIDFRFSEGEEKNLESMTINSGVPLDHPCSVQARLMLAAACMIESQYDFDPTTRVSRSMIEV